LLNGLKVAITLGSLLFVASRFDLQGVGTALAAVAVPERVVWLGLALALMAAGLLLRAFRWLVILRGANMTMRYMRLLELYVAGNFFNAVLPSGFGGDILRVAEITESIPAGKATGTVIVDRLTGLIALFVMALLALPFRPVQFSSALLSAIIVICAGGLIGGLVLLHPATARFLRRRIPERGPLALRTFADNFLDMIASCSTRPMLGALAISALFNMLQITWWAAAARSLGLPISYSYLLLVIPILAITLLVPSIGGLGVRETVAPALFAAVPLPAEEAIALSLLVFSIERLTSLLGGPVYLYTTWRDRSAR
jgi:uncharacterized protein (TIRG00374 family)